METLFFLYGFNVKVLILLCVGDDEQQAFDECCVWVDCELGF